MILAPAVSYAITPQDLPVLNRLLDEAIPLDVPERAAWIRNLPATHKHMASTLRALLLGEGSIDGQTGLRLPAPYLSATEAQPGDIVGAYRLERLLGQGGMGSVWLALRADGSIRREVALKLPGASMKNSTTGCGPCSLGVHYEAVHRAVGGGDVEVVFHHVV